MKLSVCIPIYDMPNGDWFLKRALFSLETQTFKDFEVVITDDGKMAENTNSAIKQAKGELIKILYQDDYLSNKNSLQAIVDAFTPESKWLVSGCKHDPGTHTHIPTWNDKMREGVNTIGSPSVLTMRKENTLLFDEELSWLLDCDLYQRLYDSYGEPTILNDINVTIGVGEHQTTHLLPDEVKIKEHEYLRNKYG